MATTSPERRAHRELSEIDAEGRLAQLGVVAAAEAGGDLEDARPLRPDDQLRVVGPS